MRKYQTTLDYIENYWRLCEVKGRASHFGNLRNLLLHIGRIKLPNKAITPNDSYFAGSQYYWDSYFTIIGLVVDGKTETAKGMADNLMFLYKKFGLMPARNTWLSVGRTQPPFFSRIAWEIFEADGNKDMAWMEKAMNTAKHEYENVWHNKNRYVKALGLNRYQPSFFKRLLTVYESGWDVSSRFSHGKTSIVPIDLNCMLYQYETDFLAWSKLTKNKKEKEHWQNKLSQRKRAIDKHLWSRKQKFYFDHDLNTGTQQDLKTLAGFFALWCGAASRKQAEACFKNLGVFEYEHGLANSEPTEARRRQWDYPNGWAPLQYIVIAGLRRYGFKKDADRLTKKWLDLNQKLLIQTGKMWEKYDVVSGEVGQRGRYPTQPGFAWTNAVFLRLLVDRI